MSQSGTARDPKTTVSVQLVPGAAHDVPRSDDGRDVVVSFGPAGWTSQVPFAQTHAAAGGAGERRQPQTPSLAATDAAAPGVAGATVTGVTVAPSADGYAVTIAVAGNAAFEWHRLRDPDNRFWVDVKDAQLQTAPIDQSQPEPLGATSRAADRPHDRANRPLADRAQGADRIALGDRIDRRRRHATTSPMRLAQEAAASVRWLRRAIRPRRLRRRPATSRAHRGAATPAARGSSRRAPRTFRPIRGLIVIDPGHGGSDRGSSRHGVDEADLALDVSKRLRDILVARGWQVRMTHDADVDVYQPNDSAHDELQARDDVANHAGARIFISIHANAFINSGPYGTTYYISKPSDLALAEAIEHDLASDGTKDDGIVRSHLYVTLHALMPAVLIETAFISNPNDFALLTSAAWRQRAAQSIADGIDRYARANPLPNDPAQ